MTSPKQEQIVQGKHNLDFRQRCRPDPSVQILPRGLLEVISVGNVSIGNLFLDRDVAKTCRHLFCRDIKQEGGVDQIAYNWKLVGDDIKENSYVCKEDGFVFKDDDYLYQQS